MMYKVTVRDADFGTIKGTFDDSKITPDDLFWTVSSLAHCIGANLTLEVEFSPSGNPSPVVDDLPEATE